MGEASDERAFYAGEEKRTLDDKHRLTVPARWRDPRYKEFYALADVTDPCLKLLNAYELRRMSDTIDESDRYSPAQKTWFRSRLFAKAYPSPIDGQGRILVPPVYQERFKFQGEVFLVGVGYWIELWNLERWLGNEADGEEFSSMYNGFGFRSGRSDEPFPS